jgi:uridylate kinase
MYNRVLLKLSGEALKGNTEFGIDPMTVNEIAKQIKEAHDLGIQIGIVVGGGNIWRGKTAEGLGMDRAQADYMGMLATIMNGLAVQDALEHLGVPTRVMTAITVNQVAEPYIRRKAIRHLEKGRVCIFVGGLGSPYFSTDTACVLRATEIGAEVVLMAKNGTEGIYDSDPKTNPNAKKYDKMKMEDIVDQKLGVIDLASAVLAMENHMPMMLFGLNEKDSIINTVTGHFTGTLVEA